MTIDENKAADLKATIEKLNKQLEELTTPKYEYPIWFQNQFNDYIVRFNSLYCGEVVKSNYALYKVGYQPNMWVPHTDKSHWTQVQEPQPTEWEPRGGEWFVRHYGPVGTHVSDNDSRLFGTEYKTKEQAKWAMEKMRSFNRLLAYIAEFDVDKNGKQWEANWDDEKQKKYFISHNNILNEWIYYSSSWNDRLSCYMSEQCSIDLAAKLNSGKVIL